jgi:hypothetical protein
VTLAEMAGTNLAAEVLRISITSVHSSSVQWDVDIASRLEGNHARPMIFIVKGVTP